MIDLTKVTSGYDAELNLGERFFRDILYALLTSEVIPYHFTVETDLGDLTIEILDDFTLQITSVVDQVIMTDTTFNMHFWTPVGDFALNNLTLSVQFKLYLEQDDPGDPGEIMLEANLWALDLPWLRQQIPGPYRRFTREIREALGDKIKAKEPTGITGSLVQNFAVKGYTATATHGNAVGLYFTYPFLDSPEGSRYPSRGDLEAAQCLLSSPEHTVALAVNGQIYPMLADNIRYQFAERQEDGTYLYPVYKDMERKWNKLGRITALRLMPRKYPDHDLFNPDPNDPDPLHSDPENALYILVSLRWKQYTVTGDAYLRLKVALSREDDEVQIQVTLDDVDIELDAEYIVLTIILAGFFGFVGSLIWGLVGLVFAGLVGATLTESLKAAGFDYAEGEVRSGVEHAIVSGVAPIGTLPNRVTIVRRRWDPFYSIHHQLVSKFDQCEILDEGILASAYDHRHGTAEETYLDVKLIGVTRDGDGEIVDLVYQVGKPDEIINADRFRRRSGAPPGEFLLSVEDAEDRVKFGRLRGRLFVEPLRICRRNNQIKYLQFHTGLVLTPNEAAELENKNLLIVVGGYRRVYRQGKYYYRSRADITELNNLGNLPQFNPLNAFMPVSEG